MKEQVGGGTRIASSKSQLNSGADATSRTSRPYFPSSHPTGVKNDNNLVSSISPMVFVIVAATMGCAYTYSMDLIPNFVKGHKDKDIRKAEEAIKVFKDLQAEASVEEPIVEEDVVLVSPVSDEERMRASQTIPVLAVEEEHMLDDSHTSEVEIKPMGTTSLTSTPEAELTKEGATNTSLFILEGNEVVAETSSDSKDEEIAIDMKSDILSETTTTSTLEPQTKESEKQNTIQEHKMIQDIDTLTISELKMRVSQLLIEMDNQSKWEAVRLKEFWAMKEKEISNKYLDTLQRQRLEFEDFLARRHREQEDQMIKKATKKMKEKDDSIQHAIDTACKAQKDNHDAAIKSIEKRMKQECNVKYEAIFATKLLDEKAKFSKELKKKVHKVEEVGHQLNKLEKLLHASKTYKSGSQQAHAVSAAALALSNKLETNLGSGKELAVLKEAAEESEIILNALTKVPSSVKVGIPTVVDLQTTFESVHSVSRQAAFVPEEWRGLNGQITGFLFAKLISPSSPDATRTPFSVTLLSGPVMTDLILSSAKRHVQLGEVEQAVCELDKLKGPAFFTVQDWKNAALDRIFVDKALNVIKVECALINKTMIG